MSDGGTNMKKILILSYHFPPMNVIASQRALGYANHFKKFGFEPTILTFQWGKTFEEQKVLKSDFENKIEAESDEKCKVIRIPLLQSKFYTYLKKKEGGFVYRLWILYAWFSGNLDTDPIAMMYEKSEKYYLKNYVKEKDFDLVFGVFSPHFHIKHCHYLYKSKGIPYATDYRDLWSNHITIKDYSFDSKMRLKIKLFNWYWRKWNKSAAHMSITSQPWLNKLEEITNKTGSVITNGFEKDDTAPAHSNLIDSSLFTIAHTGTIYPEQEFEFVLKGLQSFFESHKSAKCKVLFVGLNLAEKGQRNREVISKYLSSDQYLITKRIPREEVIFIQQNCQLLLFPTTVLIPGTYSGKIFEYINSGVEVLSGPKDVSAIADLLTYTKSGMNYEKEEEIGNAISERYTKWCKGELRVVETNRGLINQFSRESQTGKLAKELNKKLFVSN